MEKLWGPRHHDIIGPKSMLNEDLQYGEFELDEMGDREEM